MRSQEEITRQIEGLQNLRNSLPEYSFFGDNNHEPIDAQIDILKGSSYYKYSDEEYEIETAASNAKEWLNGNYNDDLFED